VPDATVVRCRGEMPSVPGMFGLLRVFNATRNLLTGSIPRTFGAAGIFTLVSLASRESSFPQAAHLARAACLGPPDQSAVP
jgi:hypothetical protein